MTSFLAVAFRRTPPARSLLVSSRLDPLDSSRPRIRRGRGGRDKPDGANAIIDTPGPPDGRRYRRGRPGRRTGSPACALAAQAERARVAGLLHRRAPALPLRQPRVPRLDRQDAGRSARPRGHRGRRARALPALQRVSRGRPFRRARQLRAPALVGQAQRLLDSRRLLRRSRSARRRARRARHLHRRRQHQAPRARGRCARAPPAHRHRQRRPADFLFRSRPAPSLRQQAVRRLHRHPGRRPARTAAQELRRRGRARRDAVVHRARLRRRHRQLRAPRAARLGRAALGAHHAVPGPRARRQDRRRLRRRQRHRGRHPHPGGAQVAGSAAEAVRRQHSGADRLPRQEAQVHLRQPGVRQLGVPAAGRDLRQDSL